MGTRGAPRFRTGRVRKGVVAASPKKVSPKRKVKANRGSASGAKAKADAKRQASKKGGKKTVSKCDLCHRTEKDTDTHCIAAE